MRLSILLLLITLSSLCAQCLRAAFSHSVGPVTAFGTPDVLGFTLEVDFTSSTGPETITIMVNCTTSAGVICDFTDVDRCSLATTGPQWRLAGRFFVRTSAGTTQQAYLTPNYAGRRARFALLLGAADPAGVFPVDWTVTVHNGGAAATAVIMPQQTMQTATFWMGPSAASIGLQTQGVNKAEELWINTLGGPQDRIEYEMEVDFGPTPTTSPRTIAFYGCALRDGVVFTGQGSLGFEFYDVRADGFAAPSLSFTVPHTGSGYNNGGEAARSRTIPPGVSGVHAFRLIVSGTPTMQGPLGFVWGVSLDSRASLMPLN